MSSLDKNTSNETSKSLIRFYLTHFITCKIEILIIIKKNNIFYGNHKLEDLTQITTETFLVQFEIFVSTLQFFEDTKNNTASSRVRRLDLSVILFYFALFLVKNE